MWRSFAGLCAALGLAACATAGAAPRAASLVAAGGRVAERACAGCHAVRAGHTSRDRSAPVFPALPARLPGPALEARLADLAQHGHREMPPIYMTPDERRALAAYIRRLRPAGERV